MEDRMSTNARKVATRRAKAAQGYDIDTPRCATCLYFSRTRLERVNGVTVRRTSHCGFGNFLTPANAACDEWRNHKGERIVPEQGEGDRG